MSITHRPLARLISATSLVGLIAAGCGEPPEPAGSLSSAITPRLAIGDVNRDGKYDAKDAVYYLKSLGIRFNTYGVTNDDDNPGAQLPRRPSDYNVKMIAGNCQSSAEPFPAEKLPNITQMAATLSRLPQHYLRDLGRQGFTFAFQGGLGRLTKAWEGNVGAYSAAMVFFYSDIGLTGVLSLDGRKTWEPLNHVVFNPGTGVVMFHRDAADQWYTGTVDNLADGYSTGSAIYNGTFTSAGTSTLFQWHMSPFYPKGATTAALAGGGFGSTNPMDQTCPSTPGCLCTDNAIGYQGLTISFGVADVGRFGDEDSQGAAHELGHVIRENLIATQRLTFTATDISSWETVFPNVANLDINIGGLCGTANALAGSGFVNWYGARDREEDFAELQRLYMNDPISLSERLAADQGCNGSTALAAKLDYYVQHVDVPEPVPAAAVHPATNVTYRFMTRKTVNYNVLGTYGPVPNGLSRTGVSVASNGSDRLWLAMTAKNNLAYVSSITTQWGPWLFLGYPGTRLSPSVTRHSTGQMVAYWVADDQTIHYRVFDRSSGALGATGVVPGMHTTRPVTATTAFGYNFLFALDEQSYVRYIAYSGTVPPSVPNWVNLGKIARQISAATYTPPTGQSSVRLVAVDDAFRLSSYAIYSSSEGPWALDPDPNLVAAATIAPNLTVYLTFFDDNIWTRTLGGIGSTLVPHL